MKQIIIFSVLLMALLATACSSKKNTVAKQIYTCSMHTEIIRDAPGNCPICGMKLIAKVTDAKMVTETTLASLIKPTNEFVLSSIPVTTIQKKTADIEIEAFQQEGFIVNVGASIHPEDLESISKQLRERIYVELAKADVKLGIKKPKETKEGKIEK